MSSKRASLSMENFIFDTEGAPPDNDPQADESECFGTSYADERWTFVIVGDKGRLNGEDAITFELPPEPRVEQVQNAFMQLGRRKGVKMPFDLMTKGTNLMWRNMEERMSLKKLGLQPRAKQVIDLIALPQKFPSRLGRTFKEVIGRWNLHRPDGARFGLGACGRLGTIPFKEFYSRDPVQLKPELSEIQRKDRKPYHVLQMDLIDGNSNFWLCAAVVHRGNPDAGLGMWGRVFLRGACWVVLADLIHTDDGEVRWEMSENDAMAKFAGREMEECAIKEVGGRHATGHLQHHLSHAIALAMGYYDDPWSKNYTLNAAWLDKEIWSEWESDDEDPDALDRSAVLTTLHGPRTPAFFADTTL